MGVEGQQHAPAALPPGDPVPIYPLHRKLDGPQGRSGRVRKISPPPGFDHRTVQSVAIYSITLQKQMFKHEVLQLFAVLSSSIYLGYLP
jgi:hypothetical protein